LGLHPIWPRKWGGKQVLTYRVKKYILLAVHKNLISPFLPDTSLRVPAQYSGGNHRQGFFNIPLPRFLSLAPWFFPLVLVSCLFRAPILNYSFLILNFLSMADITLSNYEITFILKADLQEMEVEKLVTKIQNSIATRGGHIITSDNWGKQRLAYPIGKNEWGYYTTLVFTHPKNSIAEFEEELKHMPEAIRHLVISLNKENIRPEQLRRLNPFADREYPSRMAAPAPTFRAPAAPTEAPKPAPKKSDKDEETRIKELDEKLAGLLGEEEK
jgi:small subunit ribosomal protein S6